MFNVNFLGDLEKKKIINNENGYHHNIVQSCVSLKTQFVPKNINTPDFVMKMKTNS
jgi:hypothetical protein